jgi:predicted oxidoreductase
MDVPAEALGETIERFNTAARGGSDPDFGRGTGAYDRAMGDNAAPHPTLRALTEGPFYAVPVHAGLGGTKGGPRTDGDGRVLHIGGGPVPGLYAAGNAAASPFGYAYPGTGATLGQALTFGALAGRAAATD